MSTTSVAKFSGTAAITLFPAGVSSIEIARPYTAMSNHKHDGKS
jgi:hypothetical protein